MNISITFKDFEPSDHLRRYAKRRFEKLARFLRKAEETEVTVVLSVDKYRHKADVRISGGGVNINAMESSEDMYATVDMVYGKAEAQIKKAMELRLEKRRTEAENKKALVDIFRYRAEGRGKERVIIDDNSRFEQKPLFDDEAAMQLELRDEEFLVFINAETDKINIIYERRNGDFALIDLGV